MIMALFRHFIEKFIVKLWISYDRNDFFSAITLSIMTFFSAFILNIMGEWEGGSEKGWPNVIHPPPQYGQPPPPHGILNSLDYLGLVWIVMFWLKAQPKL